jgi:predicted RNA binding protein YcfA (HicA-like mRNA interferase family)
VSNLKVRDIVSALLAKGFARSNRDHNYFFYYFNQKKSRIYTKISHGETDIDPHLISQMSKQISLTTKQFKQFVDCPLTAEAYKEHLLARRLISEEPHADESIATRQP